MLLTFCGRALLVSALSFTSTSTIICFPLSLLSFPSCFSLLQPLPPPLPHSLLLPPSSFSLFHTLFPSQSFPILLLSFSLPTSTLLLSLFFALTVLPSPFSLFLFLLPRVRTGPGKRGKSWNFIMAFSRTGKSWRKTSGPGKFWKSVKLN